MYNGCPCGYCPWFYYCSMKQASFYSPYAQNTARKVDHMYRQQEFTKEELAQYDGSGGKPAYIAVGGTVYDVSANGAWGGGTHFGLVAGKDLTAQFNSCHDNDGILSMLPKVGILK